LNVSFIGFTQILKRTNEKITILFAFTTCFQSGTGTEGFSGNGCL
jgi:hypothetical protein